MGFVREESRNDFMSADFAEVVEYVGDCFRQSCLLLRNWYGGLQRGGREVGEKTFCDWVEDGCEVGIKELRSFLEWLELWEKKT